MACRFFETLDKRWNAGARVCIGLDSDLEKIPQEYQHLYPKIRQVAFNRHVVNATRHLALAYKPNLAFYCGTKEGKYMEEMQVALMESVAHIHDVAPDVPVILDAKDADIGNSNLGYVTRAFKSIGADAITVHNYMGMEAMRPFLDQADKGIIVLCKTSNKGSGEFQDLEVRVPLDLHGAVTSHYTTKKLYEVVAERVAKHWNYNSNCALVVGATYPEQLGQVRSIVGDMWILAPGFGTQGGEVKDIYPVGINSRKRGVIGNSSSGIIFSTDPRAATQKLTDEINAVLATL